MRLSFKNKYLPSTQSSLTLLLLKEALYLRLHIRHRVFKPRGKTITPPEAPPRTWGRAAGPGRRQNGLLGVHSPAQPD